MDCWYIFKYLLPSSDITMDFVKEENGETIGIDDNFLPFSVSYSEGEKPQR